MQMSALESGDRHRSRGVGGDCGRRGGLVLVGLAECVNAGCHETAAQGDYQGRRTECVGYGDVPERK